jgi:hypothetical protein
MAASGGAKGSAAGVIGVVAGLMLIVGSFMTWATASIDVNAFAEALGLDPTLVVGVLESETSVSASGMTEGADGVFTLIAGVAVVLFAVLALVRPALNRVWGVLILLVGVLGTAVVLYDIAQLDDVKDAAIADAAPAFEGSGINLDILREVFSVKIGAGLIICLLGGVIALAAGVIALMTRGPASVAPGGGFAEPSPAVSADPGDLPPA